jgi:hypothetical protein
MLPSSSLVFRQICWIWRWATIHVRKCSRWILLAAMQ